MTIGDWLVQALILGHVLLAQWAATRLWHEWQAKRRIQNVLDRRWDEE
jgi:hypothetical protein